jgi:hypothetical protein
MCETKTELTVPVTITRTVTESTIVHIPVDAGEDSDIGEVLARAIADAKASNRCGIFDGDDYSWERGDLCDVPEEYEASAELPGPWWVSYRMPEGKGEVLRFRCDQADDDEHAIEQCDDANPGMLLVHAWPERAIHAELIEDEDGPGVRITEGGRERVLPMPPEVLPEGYVRPSQIAS